MKRLQKRMEKKIIGAFISACMLLIMAIPVPIYAQELANVNAQVSNARKGVVQVNLVYNDKQGKKWVVQSGSGFLIGAGGTATTVLTNDHVLSVSDELKAIMEEQFGPVSIKDEVKTEVVIKGDVTISASYVKGSEKIDFAVLELEQPIGGKEALVLGTPDHLQDIATQKVYALGFPAVVELMADYVPYTTDDVYVTDGIVSKQTVYDNTKIIQHSCDITGGNSGGPLVNENGIVIGVNTMALSDTGYSGAVQIDEITSVLDLLQIAYDTSAQAVTPQAEDDEKAEKDTEKEDVDKAALESAISDAKKVDATKYTEETAAVFEGALEDAKAVQSNQDATQGQVDNAEKGLKDATKQLKDKPLLTTPMIIGIVAAAILLIAIIVTIILVQKSKKKKAGTQTAKTVESKATTPSGTPIPSSTARRTVDYGFDKDGGGETSLLNEGEGETTLLSNQAVPQASLKRMATGETVTINRQLFKLGKEKQKVDLWISNNNSVSREHAEIVYKNNSFYIIDKKSSNFTFVNGNKVVPGQEVKLSGGDRIKISDEDFEFRQ